MKTTFKATEKRLIPGYGSEYKHEFFGASFIQQDPEFASSPDQVQLDVSPEEFFLNTPKLFICFDP
jgi:hypothetical protein